MNTHPLSTHLRKITKITPGLLLFITGMLIGAFFINIQPPYLLTSLILGVVVAHNQLPKWINQLASWQNPQVNRNSRRLEDKDEATIAGRTHELEHRLKLTQKILNSSPGQLALLDTNTNQYLFVNEQLAAFFGGTQADNNDFSYPVYERAIHPDDLPIYHDLITRLCSGQVEQSIRAEFRVRNARDEWRWISQHGVVFEERNQGRGRVLMLSGNDVTESRTTCDYLQFVSTHDALTGLYNWAYFADALEEIQKEGLFPAAVVMMDMDNLKMINDTLGHHTGDEFLREVSDLLKETFRACDVVARVGGDEFAVLLPWVNETAANDIVRRVRSRFKTALTRSGMSLDVLSFGICLATNASELIEARHQADRRMYLDKQQRKANRVRSPHENTPRYEELPQITILCQ